MPTFQTSRVVRHSPEAMFGLVADVERYPEFVPLCEKLVLRSRTPRPEGGEIVVATMTIGYKLFRESFTSRVVLDPGARTILVNYLDGPFKFLENRWAFTSEGQGCRVEFFLAYEFRSRTLAMVMGAVFDRVFGRFADAFEARADALYPATA